MKTLVQNLLSIILIGASFAFFAPTHLQAGDCNTAIDINGVTGGAFSKAPFTAGCDLQTAFGLPGFCTGDVWVEWTPGLPGQSVNNIRFDIAVWNSNSSNTTAGTTIDAVVFFLYSNSKDAGDPCGWLNGTIKDDDAFRIIFQENTFFQGVPTGTNRPRSYLFDNLDGSGTYYWVIMKSAGSAGGASAGRTRTSTAAPANISTCTNPANDDCINATVLSLNSGIDPKVTTGSTTNNVAWSAGVTGTTYCATIERPLSYNNNNNVGPDHRWDPLSPFLRAPGWSKPFNGGSPCNTGIDNSVWYRMQVPGGVSSDDWYIHIGNVACNFAGLKVTLFKDFSCTNGSTGEHVLFPGFLNYTPVCGTAYGTGGFPNPNLSIGPFDFSGSSTGWYYILVDGEDGSQCNFSMVLSRSDNNFVLPVEMSRLDGHNEGHHNILSWETATETNSWLFEVERSLDGEEYAVIGQVDAAGDSQSPIEYGFTDREAPLGIGFYRLKAIDLDGKSGYSETIEINRSTASFELHEVFPVPFGNEVNIVFSSAKEITSYIEILDVAGKVVLRETLTPTLGSNQVTLGTSNLPSGMYFIRFSQDGETIVRKVVK